MTELSATGWVTPTLLLVPDGNSPRHHEFVSYLIQGVERAMLHVGYQDASLIVEKRAIGPLVTGPGWARLARRQERAIVILSTAPRKPGVGLHSYISRYASRAATCIVPVVPTNGRQDLEDSA